MIVPDNSNDFDNNYYFLSFYPINIVIVCEYVFTKKICFPIIKKYIFGLKKHEAIFTGMLRIDIFNLGIFLGYFYILMAKNVNYYKILFWILFNIFIQE